MNATLPDRDQADALTLDDAVQLLAAKAAREGGGSIRAHAGRGAARTAAAKTTRACGAKTAAETSEDGRQDRAEGQAATKRDRAAKPAARKPVVRKTTATRKLNARKRKSNGQAASHQGVSNALDGLRGFAVLLVFCVHAAGNAAFVGVGVRFPERELLIAALRMRSASCSGCIARITACSCFSSCRVTSLRGCGGIPEVMRYGRFAWRRTLRIYPAFLVAFAASLALRTGRARGRRPIGRASSATSCCSMARRQAP